MKSIELITEKLSSIKGLSKKKSQAISENILYISFLILRGLNKNPDVINSGSIPVSWFQSKHKISRSLCAEILDICFERSEIYRTGVCKSSKLQPWLKEVAINKLAEFEVIGDLYTANQQSQLNSKEKFSIEFFLPVEKLKEASKFAKLMMYNDEKHECGKDKGKFKNNQNEYMLAHLYLEAAIKRGGYFCENYHYANCGRPYQSNYGFQNMKKNVRNIVFKDHYIIDINSSFYRMAYELYAEEWPEELRETVNQMINNKTEYFSKYSQDEHEYQDFKISLISCLLGTTDVYFIYLNDETQKMYKLLNSWRSPAKRRLIANELFSKEQYYIKKQIEKMNTIPYVLIHDALIIKEEIKDIDKNMWSIKKV
jgi:hypothetical protein